MQDVFFADEDRELYIKYMRENPQEEELDMRWRAKRTDLAKRAARIIERGKLDGEVLILHTRRGQPLGDNLFMAKMEALMGHRLRPLPLCRPKKMKDK